MTTVASGNERSTGETRGEAVRDPALDLRAPGLATPEPDPTAASAHRARARVDLGPTPGAAGPTRRAVTFHPTTPPGSYPRFDAGAPSRAPVTGEGTGPAGVRTASDPLARRFRDAAGPPALLGSDGPPGWA